MNETHRFTDEDLTAYLDGEAEAGMQAAIMAALVSEPALKARLSGLQISVTTLRESFDSLLASAPPLPALPGRVPDTAAPAPLPKATLAACLVLGLALGAGLMSLRERAPDWMDYVAAYQALYVESTLNTAGLSTVEKDLNLASLGAVLGHNLEQAGADSILDFKRGQILGYKGQPLIQLAYLGPMGEPVALCIIRTGSAERVGVTLTRLEGMAAAHWQQDGLAFLLIGGTDSTLIAGAADRLSAEI